MRAAQRFRIGNRSGPPAFALVISFDINFNNFQARVRRQLPRELLHSKVRLTFPKTVVADPVRASHLSPQPNAIMYGVILTLRPRACWMVQSLSSQ